MFRKQLLSTPILLVLVFIQIEGKKVVSNSLKPPVRLETSVQVINGEHISLEFYAALKSAELAKNNLQSLLHNFLENLQRNLSTSPILNGVIVKPIDFEVRKLNDLAEYFKCSSETAGQFAQKAEEFFEASKNESYSLLLKLRQVPSTQRFLPTVIKMHLTDYFAEMEFFHVMLSEIIDQALEYVVDTMRSVQSVFIHYANIQRGMLRSWTFELNEWCCSTYMDFLQHWSAQIFKCGASNELQVAYDVYATTETYTKHIMQQLQFRIQRLYNCFIFGQYEVRCQFLRKPENDFDKLLTKLDELQQYFDINIKRGRVTITRSGRRRRRQDETKYYDKCIPYGFPYIQLMSSLQNCFNSSNSTQV